ncbi:MAG: phenylacetate--CoA ligase family protein [candidate division Zixibacteria bacterium]|nr:phenylacetate--CoA ligase family protein [candidate division Zixibacteria bacterium]
MNSWISRNLFYRPIYSFRGERVNYFMRQVRDFHSMSAAQMQDVQWRKLFALLEYVGAHNPYYRTLFRTGGISVNAITSYADFARIPILTKDALRQEISNMRSEGPWKVAPRKTSGSTGVPLHFVKDRVASAYNDALMYEVYGWHGVRMGDRQSRFWGLPLDQTARLKWQAKDLLLNRKRFNSFIISAEYSISYFHTLQRFRPKFVYGYPSAICEFASHAEQQGLHVRDLRIPVIITTGEMLFPAQREQLETMFACTVANEYGSTENGIIAFPCRQGGMHLMNHNLYIEVLDPVTNAPVSPGEKGVVVVTELHSYAFPFVRYRLGDMVVPSSDACPCGLPLPVIESIEGRVSDMILAADGSKVAGPIINYTMTKGVRRFKAIQESQLLIRILVEPGPGFSLSELDVIRERWHALLGAGVTVDIQVVESIPADPSGKLRAFESRLRP